jgi:hypothetical protein
MITLMFWNLGRQHLTESLQRLVVLHEVDLLVLAECGIGVSEMLGILNASAEADFYFNDGDCDRIAIYSRFPPDFMRPVSESARYTIRRLRLPGQIEVLLAAVHFPSKLFMSDDSLQLECVELAKEIQAVENEVGHARTVLVGDFNMNPFETGVAAAGGLHAVMAKSIAAQGARKVQERSYPFFYNPMWGHFGDASKGPPGTYYYQRAEHKVFFWNMFDQVLIRPDLLDRFDNDHLSILTSDGAVSFLSSAGKPDGSVASDHLPILFRLNL